jgi:hypothetical protein
MSFTGIPELKESYRKLGAFNFWATMICLFGWTSIGISLQRINNYPDAYGFQCSGRGCLYREIWNSPVLLRDPDAFEIGLFAWLWSMPATVVGALIYAAVRKLRSTDFSLYSDSKE